MPYVFTSFVPRSHRPRAAALPLLLLLAALSACANSVSPDAGADAAPHPVVCAAITCAAGEACCLATGACFDPVNDHAACTLPGAGADGGAGSDAAPPPPPPVGACASNADCTGDEICWLYTPRYEGCLGTGTCTPRADATRCYGMDGMEASCPVCGCDGVTYDNPEAAWSAGVNYHGGACGVDYRSQDPDAGYTGGTVIYIPCGNDTQCPGGAACCAFTGFCFDTACPDCCRMPPPGTDYPCVHNSDCPHVGQWCQGGPACDSPGGCVDPPPPCDGHVDEVCGCDGRTYTNECWAHSALVRVAATGACDGG